MKKLIFATRNKGKVSEVRYIFGSDRFSIVSLDDINYHAEIIEDGSTFEENAKIKANQIYKLYKVPVIADDSGLEVEKLNGEPGINSARYAGIDASDEENNDKLISKLKDKPKPINAKFICAAVLYNGEKFITSIGTINGRIIDKQRGDGGFGYDPLFVPDGFNQTLAEMAPELKNKISHRYKAFSKLKNLISGL